MTKKVHLRLKGVVGTLCFALIVLSGKAQYNADSLEALRTAKLDRLATDPSFPLDSTDVTHIHYYNADNAYRITATVERLHHEQPFRISTSDGTSKEYVRYAKLRFTIYGTETELTAYRSTELFADPIYRDHLFLPFTDETNGVETYGGGRYIDLSVADIQNGNLVIDFNNAYNPYCAYAGGYRCPIPPVENNLAIAIHAGEKRYTGPIKERPKPVMTTKSIEDGN